MERWRGRCGSLCRVGKRTAGNELATKKGREEGRERGVLTWESLHASKSLAAIIKSVGSFWSGERMATCLAMAAAVLGWSPVTMLRKGKEVGREEGKGEF